MNAVATQHGRGACSDPNASERIRINLVLLDKALALLVHVDTAVLPVVDLIVPYYWVAVRANLRQKKNIMLCVLKKKLVFSFPKLQSLRTIENVDDVDQSLT